MTILKIVNNYEEHGDPELTDSVAILVKDEKGYDWKQGMVPQFKFKVTPKSCGIQLLRYISDANTQTRKCLGNFQKL